MKTKITCRYYSLINNHCTHRGNKDTRSKKKSGQYRHLPRRCLNKFCPLIKNK